MSRPVSLVVWRDAKTDPPTGDMERYVLVIHDDGFVEQATAREVDQNFHTYHLWAELPVLSELTDEDILWAHREAHYASVERAFEDGDRERFEALSQRLRAALGGKEEACG